MTLPVSIYTTKCYKCSVYSNNLRESKARVPLFPSLSPSLKYFMSQICHVYVLNSVFPLIDTSAIMISSTARGIVCQDCRQFIPEQSFDDWLNGLPDHVCNPAQNLSTREIRPTATPPQRRVSSPRVLTTMTSTSAKSTPIEQRAL